MPHAAVRTESGRLREHASALAACVTTSGGRRILANSRLRDDFRGGRRRRCGRAGGLCRRGRARCRRRRRGRARGGARHDQGEVANLGRARRLARTESACLRAHLQARHLESFSSATPSGSLPDCTLRLPLPSLARKTANSMSLQRSAGRTMIGVAGTAACSTCQLKTGCCRNTCGSPPSKLTTTLWVTLIWRGPLAGKCTRGVSNVAQELARSCCPLS